MRLLLFLLPLLASFHMSMAWDEEELEIFDLVEEVNEATNKQTFYEYLGLADQKASTAEIRKAYRKLSLVLHPDKNDADDAELKFRLLAGIYEVLKDSNKREIYDRVLVEGLPDWRMPIFYIRRMRKMNFGEGLAYLILIFTVCQYFVNWAAYWERKFTLQEQVSVQAKKMAKKSKGKKNEEEFQAAYAEEEEKVLGPKPTCYDTLPFQAYRGGKAALIALPGLPGQIYNAYKEQKEKKEEEERLEREEEEERLRILEEKKERKEKAKQRKYANSAQQYKDRSGESDKNLGGGNRQKADAAAQARMDVFKMPKNANQVWTDADLARLAKMMKKYPAGTPERWEKIAEALQRTAAEVTKMAGKVKSSSYQVSISNASQGVTGLEDKKMISDSVMELPNDVATTTDSDGSGSESGEDDGDTDDSNYGVYSVASKNDYVPVQVKDKKKTKGGKDATGANNNEESSADQSSAAADWSQKEQKMLEQALGQFPKGTAERWDRIAGKVPGRSKNECMLRVRHLAELVQSRKQQQEKSGDEKPTTNGTASA